MITVSVIEIFVQNLCTDPDCCAIYGNESFPQEKVKQFVKKYFLLGVSQISGASRTSVGGYDVPETEDEVTSAQFDVSDQRSLDEIVNWLMGMGDIPSFCTACYRAGRTGDRFMSLCKSKQISNCCHPNALMTLMEYLQDYASPETKKVGLELIQKELENIPGEKIRKLTEEHLADIVNGQRDFRF